jgi:hypothetical protein
MAYQEGATATNKETGQRYVFRGGKWEELQQLKPTAFQAGSQASPFLQGVLTTGQGLTSQFLDELAGAEAMRGASQMQRGMGMAGIQGPQFDPMQAGPPMQQFVRGATTAFAERNPVLAPVLETAGGLATVPFTMGGSAAPLGANAIRRGAGYIAPIAGQSALGAAGASEAETAQELATDVLYGTGAGIATGGAAGLGIKGGGAAIRRMVPGMRQDFELQPARERLAQLLQRDLYARMPPDTISKQDRVTELERQLKVLPGPSKLKAQLQEELDMLTSGIEADPIAVAAARLQRPRGGGLGPEAPIAATGAATRSELGLLRNQPGSTMGMIERGTRPLVNQRGDRLIAASDRALDAENIPYRATVNQYTEQARAKSAPYYAQLENVDFPVDAGLAKLISRASKAFSEAEELALVEGMEKLNLGNLRPGDRVPFEVLDTLKKTLYDIEDAARTPIGKATEKSRAYTNLRREFIDKLDQISPKDNQGQSIYQLARANFGSETQLKTAMERGRKVMNEDVEEISDIIDDMEPSQLRAFRLGAAQALRDQAGTPAGQTKLMNLQKSPAMQKRLRLIFGNNFRDFQATVLREAELQKTARMGEGSQTGRLIMGEQDQNVLAQALRATQAAQGDVLTTAATIAEKGGAKKLTERQRQQLAELLLLKGQPAQDELRNLRLYIDRRAAAQKAAQQASGRIGATGAAQRERI